MDDRRSLLIRLLQACKLGPARMAAGERNKEGRYSAIAIAEHSVQDGNEEMRELTKYNIQSESYDKGYMPPFSSSYQHLFWLSSRNL